MVLSKLFPSVCSAAFVLECSQGRGKIVGSLIEQSAVACAYRGELLGLMAIHLIFLAASKLDPLLTGSAAVFSDCLGALEKIATLPAARIPSYAQHADILKNVMLHCRRLPFDLAYSHVKAHQDDHVRFNLLVRPAQLNCIVDELAKFEIRELAGLEALPSQETFPLEPVAVFAGGKKLTSDTGDTLRFVAHKELARQAFHEIKLMFASAFHEVDWDNVYAALHSVPRMFQVWACKQVTDSAGTNEMQARYTPDHDPVCPSCDSAIETCEHVLFCDESGRVEALRQSIRLLRNWLRTVGTDPRLERGLIAFACWRGGKQMEEIVEELGDEFAALGRSMDAIGWRRFMEGMVSKQVVRIQRRFIEEGGRCDLSADIWVQQLAVRLLEVTHGQWLFRNVHVHDHVAGVHATRRKEELWGAIEDQLELGGEGLDEQDRYLLEINLEDLETTTGEDQTYWLLAIQAARESRLLRLAEDQEAAEQAST